MYESRVPPMKVSSITMTCAIAVPPQQKCGAAIHTARLHAETQRNAHQMATIANVGRELSATLNLDVVVKTVVENVHKLFDARDIDPAPGGP